MLVVVAGLAVVAGGAVALARGPLAHHGDAGPGPLVGPGVPRHPPVVFVVFDELPLVGLMGPDGRIDASRYPSFAALADASLWFRGDTSVHDSTGLAVPAILSGRYPRRALPPKLSAHPVNLFTVMRRRYALHVSEEATFLCPQSVCPPVPGSVLRRLGGGRARRFRAWMRTIGPTRRPTLWFKHVLLPHVPWVFYPSGTVYRRGPHEPIPGQNGPPGFGVPWLVTLSYQRMLLQLGFADKLLGELLDRLHRTGVFDRAMIVVVADHGIAFNRGADRRTVTPRNIGALAPVPLFVKLPRERRGELVDRHVESIDIFPTILKVAHLRVPRHLDARSLLHPPARQRRWVTDYHRIGTRLDTVGGRYVFSVARVSRARHAELRRKLRLFGSGGGAEPARLFRVGPYPRLVGRPVAQLRRLPRRLPAARIHQARQLRKVDPRSGFVPGEITGTLPGSTRPGSAVAVAVNGRIEAVGRSFVLAGSRVERFAFVVPSWSLRPGRNAVRVYEVVGAGRALRPL